MPLTPLARCFVAAVLCPLALPAQSPRQPLQPHTLAYAPGKSITLSLPADLDINIAASGLRRVRFMTQSPDGRIFAGVWEGSSGSGLHIDPAAGGGTGTVRRSKGG